MKIPEKTYVHFIVLIMLMLSMGSCNNSPDPIPLAKNSISGTVEGTPFVATDIVAVKDSNQIFSIKGIINSEASFSLYFKDDGSSAHPIEEEGAFRDLADRLEDLFNADPPLADSVLQDSLTAGLADLLSDTENLLAPNHSFMFYTVGGLIYYSLDGNYIMDELNPELKRLNGTLNVRLSNFFGGRKDMEAVLEDVQFFANE